MGTVEFAQSFPKSHQNFNISNKAYSQCRILSTLLAFEEAVLEARKGRNAKERSSHPCWFEEQASEG
jgi:hypothetical protein